MHKVRKKLMALLLVLSVMLSLTVSAAALSETELDAAVEDTAAYMYKTVASPQVGSVGGEWAVIGLARSGYPVPEEYYQNYYATVEEYIKACGGVLHEKKYTEYSRVIVALSSIGKDARDVAGYDLTKALGDYENVIWQGINGPIWALIALDSRDYPMPQNPEAKTQATRQMYVDEILSRQLADGGWSLTGNGGDTTPSDPDITGMALQALAKYQDQKAVAEATEEALLCMSEKQTEQGGFTSWGSVNSESCVQIIVALCELGIPLDDARFVKNGETLLDNLMTFYREGNGFLHVAEGTGSSQMASEQGLYGLVAAQRAMEGKNSLYRMGDAETIADRETAGETGQGLPGKNPAVQAVPVTAPGKTFEDISGANAHKNQPAIEALAARGIIDGMSDGTFAPDSTMTRAQFAAIAVRGMGLEPKATGDFTDVPAGAWYAGYIGTASSYGIINGRGDGIFDPESAITRQEAAALVCRAAELCGMDIEMDAASQRDTLAQFGDYITSDEWARPSLAFCYEEDILDQSDLNIRPKEAILRCEIAQMIYNMLVKAELL
ncbi:MAG: S-layer homology domain-containing protein [Candidatus Heteroscillospira sp.]